MIACPTLMDTTCAVDVADDLVSLGYLLISSNTLLLFLKVGSTTDV